jgi:formylglycine-generating enzyme required for sulfatase activity
MAVHLSYDALSQPLLVRIPSGWFYMGCDSGQDNERPVRRVWVDGFLLAATQVTNAEYALFLHDTRRAPPPQWNDAHFRHAMQPVVSVSWFDASQYCDWLRSRTARPFRLPTEAEWERAARAGLDSRLYPWGDDPPQTRPDYARRWLMGPQPVAQQAPNAYGLYDICENVHEWCGDWYAPDYYSVAPDCNPLGPATGERRSSRGGSWRHHIKISRCAARSSIPPAFCYADYGFRVACDL